jgi:hypothetical protein
MSAKNINQARDSHHLGRVGFIGNGAWTFCSIPSNDSSLRLH